ncbi:hypothetical protein [Granulicella sibirica]|uniref:Uncharacterized protein n=1 Tax=Granulicella sibirica TaxID=2479048 RepID=A0A4Q0T8Q0_9BACT|nr:hypothetical protein [Granulicella sibirica]RXH58409.1 hypothetical protein GRAN_1719 [Granulicella sibirica]
MKQSPEPASASDPVADLLPNLASFIEDGEVTIGIVNPVGCVATAADQHASIAMLVGRKNETLTELLTRLDSAIGLALTEDIFTDEVNQRPKGK